MKINSALLPLLLQFVLFFFMMMLDLDTNFNSENGRFQLKYAAQEYSFKSFVLIIPSFILFLLQNMLALKAKKDENRWLFRLYATVSMFIFIGIFCNVFQPNVYNRYDHEIAYGAFFISTLTLSFICLIWRNPKIINIKDFEEIQDPEKD